MPLSDSILRAIQNGDFKRLDSLLQGWDFRTENGEESLLRAVLIGLTEAPDPQMVQYLIDRGSNVNAKDRMGWTPLHFAARNKSPRASPTASAECVRALVEAGADVNAKDKEGVTPLHRSVFERPWNLEIIEILLSAGAMPTPNFLDFLNAIADYPEKRVVLSLLSKKQL